MGSRLLGIIVKEFIHLKRDVLALVLALAVPVGMLFIFGWAINTDVKHIPTAVFEQSGSLEARLFLEAMENSQYFDVRRRVSSHKELTRLIDSGEAKVGVVIHYVARAYADRPLPIGHGQTISQPYIVGYMTAQLQPQPGQRVLEIGTGSGYQAAVLSQIVGEIFTIEIVPPLAERARKLLLEQLELTNIQVRSGDGFHGWPEAAPFDAIIVTAAAETIPPPLLAQLKDDGRMIIPVGPALGSQHLVLVTKEGGKVRTRTLMPVRFVPFTRSSE